MKAKTLLGIFLFIVVNSLSAQEWGERIYDNVSTTYEIYKKNFNYTDSPFLITDIRKDSSYWGINSFNIQNLSVYRAKNENGFLPPQPVVFFVHGGGWTDGYASWYDFISLTLTGEAGWTVVNVDYRLTSDSVFVADENCPDRWHCDENLRKKAAWYPDNIEDVAKAFKWTLENISRNGGDSSKIFIMGHSAGGHLVSLFATDTAYSQLAKRIKGTISISGAYDIKNINPLLFKDVIDQTFHGGFENNDAELDSASPLFYVRQNKNIPPFFLIHCQFDLPSLPSQALQFKDTLSSYGIAVESDFLTGYNHMSEIVAFSEQGTPPVTSVENYIKKRLSTLAVKEESPVPERFILYQNYPNPFSAGGGTSDAVTTIKYSLPDVGTTHELSLQLTVYDVLGREVATLVNEVQSPGNYSVKFNAGNLPGGVYFCRLSAGSFSKSIKMILLK